MKTFKKYFKETALIILLIPWLFFKFCAGICSFLAELVDKFADRIERGVV